MYKLKTRQKSILQSLINQNDGIKIDDLLSAYKISKRTLYYDIDKINPWLIEDNLGRVLISNQTVFLQVLDNNRLEKRIKQKTYYFFGTEERRALEIIYIVLYHKVINIALLSDLLDVSRNTVLMDIKEIKNNLKEYNLNLNNYSKGGYILEGEETKIRDMLESNLRLLTSNKDDNVVVELFRESLMNLLDNDIDYNELCKSIIWQYAIDSNTEDILSDVRFNSIKIQMALIRAYKGYSTRINAEEKIALSQTVAYRSVEISAQKLKIHNVNIPQSEIFFITTLLLGMQISKSFTQEEEDKYFSNLSNEFVSTFERIACLFITDKDYLQKQLIYHIKPLFYRLKYNINLTNPMLEDIKTMYPFIFDVTRRTVKQIEEDFPKELSDAELAYLVVYMVSALNEKLVKKSEVASPRDVLIVGAENMATATMVKDQLTELFGDAFNYRIINQNRLRKWMLDDYILVVFVNSDDKEYECDHKVVTDPILNKESQKEIIDILKKVPSLIKYDKDISDIIEVVKNNGNIIEENKLYFDLFDYFSRRYIDEEQQVSGDTFDELIKNNEFIKINKDSDFKSAVLLGAKEIGESNLLVDRISNLLLHDRVRYYSCFENVVLIHYPMQGDTNAKVNVKIGVSKNGIILPDNKKANILVYLSTVDNYKHLDLLQRIYNYFDSNGQVRNIIQRV